MLPLRLTAPDRHLDIAVRAHPPRTHRRTPLAVPWHPRSLLSSRQTLPTRVTEWPLITAPLSPPQFRKPMTFAVRTPLPTQDCIPRRLRTLETLRPMPPTMRLLIPPGSQLPQVRTTINPTPRPLSPTRPPTNLNQLQLRHEQPPFPKSARPEGPNTRKTPRIRVNIPDKRGSSRSNFSGGWPPSPAPRPPQSPNARNRAQTRTTKPNTRQPPLTRPAHIT